MSSEHHEEPKKRGRKQKMKYFFALLATLFFAAPVWAVDVAMNSDGLLLFEPSDITINRGESIHFVNGMLPPHNIIVDGRPDLSRESLFFSPGQTQDIVFADSGDYDFYCGHHHAAGMVGKIHVK